MSSSSIKSSLEGRNKRMAFPKCKVDIQIDNHYKNKVYTSGSVLKGNVAITAQKDVPFGAIDIILTGGTTTRQDNVGAPNHAMHTFLKIPMPVADSLYPTPRLFESGRTYTIPFHFVIPNHLTIGACNHSVSSELVHDAHTAVPPSVGGWDKDDMAPDMVKVEYKIKAKIMKESEIGGNLVNVFEAEKLIQVLPGSSEQPPLSIGKEDRLYSPTKSKTIRKGLLSGRLGKMTISAAQPAAAIVSADGCDSLNTSAQIDMQFEPCGADTKAPDVTRVSAKLSAYTFFAAGHVSTFPNHGDWTRTFSPVQHGQYSTSTPIFSQSVHDFAWTGCTSLIRRDSGYSSSSESPAHSDSDSSRRASVNSSFKSDNPLVRSAVLQVPIKLPTTKKTFIPTFHSCIASRVYVLHLSVTVNGGTTLNVSVPLQVGIETAIQQDPGLPSFDAALQEAEVDAHLQPRVLGVPEQDFQQTSILPGYGHR